tara:strand:- start:287 stop:637 length:351 start_codon:yes stop_codon:yes gene_type:complete
MIGGETFVPKIPSYRVIDIAKAIDNKKKIIFVGIRPGEKLHEEMITVSDSQNTLEFNNFFIIKPSSEYFSYNSNQFCKVNKLRPKKIIKKNFSYNSLENKDYLSLKQLRAMINKHF